jgi:glyoxylase-like metal-dependent hydrolase (beta-lactamase superfamily II)
MNQWLAAAPDAEVAHGAVGCMVQLNDLADRPPRPLGDCEVLDLGDKRILHLDTPHVPHAWEAQVLYEETTGTLLCGDLFAHVGNGPAITTEDLVERAMEGEAMFRSSSLAPDTAIVLGRLADLAPQTLALMHGSSFSGDGESALRNLANAYDERYLSRT